MKLVASPRCCVVILHCFLFIIHFNFISVHYWLPLSDYFSPSKLHFVKKLHWTDSSVHLLLSVYLTTIPPPPFLLSLSSQCFGCCPVAMKRPQQWPLSVRAHHCPRNAYLIVACFDRGNTKSCLPAELFHGLILLFSLAIRLRPAQGHQ